VAGWTPFVAVAIGLVCVLLVLSRRSADVIDEYSTAEDDPQSERAEPGVSESTAEPDRIDDSAEPDWRGKDADPEWREDTVEPEWGEESAEPDWRDDEFEDPPGVGQPQQVELSSWLLMANVGVTQGVVILILAVAGWYFEIPLDAFGIPGETLSGLPAVGVGVVFGAVLWVANDLSTTLADAVGAAYDEGVRKLLAPDSPQGWVVLITVVLPIIATAEELLFRAALVGVPEAGFGVNVWVLAALSSLAFALGHGAQGRVGVVVTGTLGFVLAAGYVLTGSLLVVVVAHYVINALEFLVHEYLDVDLFSTGSS
jgi:membrane protease YdiL (CAAX protease family)